jgi:hypothetical protein
MSPVGHVPDVTQPLAKSATGAAPEPAVAVTRHPGNRGNVATDVNRHLVLFPTRYATYVPAGHPAQSASGPAFGVLPTSDGGKVVWAVR